MRNTPHPKKEYVVIDRETLMPVKTFFGKEHETHLFGRRLSLKNWSVILLVIILIGAFCVWFFNRKVKSQLRDYEIEYTDMQEELAIAQHESNLHNLIGYYVLAEEYSVKLSDSVLWAFIVESGAWYPEVVMAQAKIESGCGRSNVAKKSNNLFGMKKIHRTVDHHRVTTQTPHVEYNSYGIYSNWQLSVLDRVLWDIHVFKDKKPSRKEYYEVLSSLYAEDESYVAKVRAQADIYLNEFAGKN